MSSATPARMNILMVCPQFRPIPGGYERAAERLSIRLAERGHSVTVATDRRDRSWPRHELYRGFSIRRTWCLRGRWLVPSAILGLAFFLLTTARRFDVIHVHQYGWSAGVALAIGRVLGVPVVVKSTNTGKDGVTATLERMRATRLLLALHRRADRWIAMSRRAFDEIVDLGVPEERITTIPNGVDTEHFAPADPGVREELRGSLVASRKLVLYVGRMVTEKQPLVLIDAWSRLERPSSEAVLCMLGDGPLMKEVEALVRARGLEDSVFVQGRVDDPLPWFQAADMLVVSSRNEGLSNSVLEGLSCGLPLVSTRVSGCEDILEASEAGVLVDHADAGDLAQAIARLLDDAETRSRCGRIAREYAVGTFSLERVAEQAEALYRQLARG